MTTEANNLNITNVVSELIEAIEALPLRNTASIRRVRLQLSRRLRHEPAEMVLRLARRLLELGGYRWIAYELIHDHKGAFASLDEALLEELGRGINRWSAVDGFARTLSGPAWRDGQVDDDLIRKWAHSDDRWWRRAALVSTVALNVRSRGGYGDTKRTLDICRLLVEDHDDMVAKAMSWALRELIPHDPDAVRRFLHQHDDVLAARVKREVRNKLSTGLKNPRGKKK